MSLGISERERRTLFVIEAMQSQGHTKSSRNPNSRSTPHLQRRNSIGDLLFVVQVKIHNLAREQRLIEQTNRSLLRAGSILIPPDSMYMMSPIMSNHGSNS